MNTSVAGGPRGDAPFSIERFLLRTDQLRTIVREPAALDWLVIGDSVAAGSTHTVGGRNYAELLAERLRVDGKRTGDVIINSAVPGWSTADANQHLDSAALRFRAAVTFVGLGFNDCRAGHDGLHAFESEYDLLLERLAESGSLPVVQIPNATLPTVTAPVHDVLPEYRDVMLELAARRALPVIDHYGIWHDVGDLIFHDWIGHGCHPNAFGHRMMARSILAGLGLDVPESPTIQLTVPGAPRILAAGKWVR